MGFLSSLANQKSYEDPDRQHGLFTYYLLRGLEGEADEPPSGNNDGVVRAGELLAYLQRVVPARAKELQISQMPTLTPYFDDKLPVGAANSDIAYGIYSEGIPEEALRAVRLMVKRFGRIQSISFDEAGNWDTGLPDGGGESNSHALGKLLTEPRKPDVTGHRQYVALGPSGAALVFYDLGYKANDKVPAGMIRQLDTEVPLKLPFRDPQFGPNGTWLFLQGEQGFWGSDKLPRNLLERLQSIKTANHRIEHVALRSSGGWAIIHDGFHATASRVPARMMEALGSLRQRQIGTQAIAFDPQTDGWILVADRPASR
jgi:hypothetical protein